MRYAASKGRILVADDEEGVRSFIAEALARDGHEVVLVEDGTKASVAAARESFDAVVTDLKMPGMDGMALLRKLRAEQPELQVIVLTAHGSVETAVEAMKAGAFDYLQKPISGPAELRLLLRRALERRKLLNLSEGGAQASRERLTWGAPAMAPVTRAIDKVSPTNASVLLVGQSGTGKEVVARAIHERSTRSDGPFMAVNCATLSEQLLESELFGHEKGAFTGATARRRGRIELAQGGTFFLDELGELKPNLQARLLRVVQERTFERVGGAQTIVADVRWIAATNRDLQAMIAGGAFREDLYHRLAVFPIHLPSLHERAEDISPLAQSLLARIGTELGKPGLTLSERALSVLKGASLPGNVRQLRNVLERAAILASGTEIEPDDLQLEHDGAKNEMPDAPRTLAELERAAIQHALVSAKGNRKQAAQALGIGLRTLYDKLKKYGV